MRQATKLKAVDSVCGMEVDMDTPFKAGYQGETFYFCTQQDKDEFQDRPSTYARKAHMDMPGNTPPKNDPDE
jgi:YHS domain-containing protein